MPIYRITAPNGKTYEIEGPPGASDADVAQAVLAQYPEAGKPPAQSTLTGEVVRGAKQLGSSIRTGVESVFSPEEAAVAGVERGKKISEEAGEGPSFAAVRKAYEERGLLPAVGEAVSQIPRAVAGQLPQLATMAGGARLGATAGSVFGPMGTLVGGGLGAGVALLPQFMGANVERQAQEQMEQGKPVDISRTKAYAGAAGQAALEGVGATVTLGKRVVKGILGIADDAALASVKATAKAQEELVKAAARSLPAAAGRGALRGTAEIPVEIAQQIIERAQAGLDLMSPEAFSEYGEAAYLAGLVGPTIGGGAGVVETRRARRAAAPPPGATAELPIEEARRLEAEKAAAEAPPQIPPMPESYTDLIRFSEQVKAMPKSAQRTAALKEASQKRQAIIAGEVEAGRLDAERAKGFLTAEEAATAEITSRAELEAKPVEKEIPEPTVRGEAPTTGLNEADILALGISKKQPILKRMLGKDMTVPEQRDAVLADIENYLNRGNGSEESREKLTAFKEQYKPTPPAPVVETPAVPEVPSAPTAPIVEQPSGTSAPVVSEPSTGGPTEGLGVTEPTGVVPAVTDVGQLTEGKAGEPSAVTAPVAEAAAAPKEKGNLATRVKNLGVSAVTSGVPDFKIIRDTLEARDPRYYRGVMHYLGRDVDGNALVGANNMPQTPSLKEAAEMAGLGANSSTQLGNVARALGITQDVRRKALASQTDLIVTGRAVSEAGTGADVETPKTTLIKDQSWYEPIGRKGIDQVNDTELARAAVRADRFLENPANEPAHADIMAEVQKRANRPEFRSALRNEFGVASEEVATEEGVPGQEEAVGEEGAEDIAELGARPAPGTVSPAITQAATSGDTIRTLQAVTQTPEATPLDHAVAQRFIGLGQFLGLPKIEVVPRDQINKDGEYNSETDTVRIAEGQVDTHTVLHETAHGFVHKLIVANEKGLRSDEGYKDLKRLYDYLLKNHPELKGEYGMSSLTEFSSEAMSNPQFQKKLGKIPYKARSAWSVFVESVRKLLKLMPGTSSALGEAIASVDSLLRVGREYQTEGPSIKAGTAALAPGQVQAQPIGTKEETGFSGFLERKFGSEKIIGLRAKVADSLAAVDAFFSEKYGGRIKDNQGNANPIVLLSRALDSMRFSKVAQETGTLKRDAEGLIVADKLIAGKEFSLIAGQEVSYLKALQELKRTGLSKEEVGKVLIGHREHGLRELVRAKRSDYVQTLTDAQIDAYERRFQSDQRIQRISQMLDAVRFSMIDLMEQTGRIDAAKAAEWKEATGYIPFSRLDALDGFYESGITGKRGAAIYRNMKKLSGDPTRQLENPLDTFSGLIDWMTRESMTNEASSRALQEMSLFNAAEKIPSRETKSNNEQGAIVEAYVGGQKTFFYVPDPALLGAFSYAPPTIPSMIKAMQRGSRVLRAGVTSMPPFVVKQVFDDITRMYAFAGLQNNVSAVKRVLTDFPRIWWAEAFGKKHKIVADAEARGLAGTFDFTEEGNVRNIMAEAGVEKRGLGSRMLHFMEAGAKASDLAVRNAIYEQVLKETGSHAEAENRAREIINFSRRGNAQTMDYFIRTVPFFNAFARGTDKLLVAAAGGKLGVGQSIGQPRAMFWKRMGTLTAMATVYALLMSDDDEYNKLPDRVRDRNIILPFNKEFVEKYGVAPAIPLPADLAFIFKAIPERVIQYYRLQGTPEERTGLEITRELLKQGIDIFSTPNITPQVVRPILENMLNTSFFLDRPLESQAQQNLRPFERYGMGTSDVAKSIAAKGEDIATRTGVEAFAISPIKLENFIRGMLGTIGGTVLAVGDAMINPTRTDRPLQNQLIPQLTGASALMKDAVGSRFLDEMYRLDREAEQVYNTYRRLSETDPDRAERFVLENYGLYAMRDSIKSIMGDIRNATATASAIDKMSDLSSEDRRDMINILRRDQAVLAKQAYELRRLINTTQMQVDKQLR